MRPFAKIVSLLAVGAFVLMVCLVADQTQAQEPNESPFVIKLQSRTFTPTPGLDSTISAGSSPQADRAQHILVQLYAMPTETERAALAARGVRLLGYIPHNTWLASVTGRLDLDTPAEALIRWAGPLLPEDKIEPSILEQGIGPWATAPDGGVQLQVQFFADVSDLQAAQVIAQQAGQVLSVDSTSQSYVAWFPQAAVVKALAAEDNVQWVGNVSPTITLEQEPADGTAGGPIGIQNDLARIPTNVDDVQALGLNGSGAVVGIWDSGAIFNHPDLASRLIVVTGAPVSGNHATHVAGIAAGDGQDSVNHGGTANQWRGVATAATLLSYAITDPDIEGDHGRAITTYGLDISQNSWGTGVSEASGTCDLYGDYTSLSQRYDRIVKGQQGKPIVTVFSAGNDRNDGDCGQTGGPDYINYNTMNPPKSAKNIIAVGATYSDDNDGMTTFSNWGPVDDGRIRPDVAAPGHSLAQQVVSTANGGGYTSLLGTSMAAPHVSGIAALLIQRYRLVFAGKNPLPSTIKALLIQTAKDLNDGTSYYNPGPDFASGYGRVDALAAYNILTPTQVIEGGLLNGNTDTYAIAVTAATPPLKATLVWDDPPAELMAATQLVNNLDLELIAPDETTVHRPWVLNPLNPSAPATTGIDSLNNVEQVYVENPDPGLWTVRVKGTQLPQEQSYSLIISHPLASTQYLPVIRK